MNTRTGNNKILKQILDDVVSHVKYIYGDKLEKIILYGSYARGTEEEESDIDLLALIDLNDEEIKLTEDKINEAISEIGYNYIKLISIIEMNMEKFNYWKKVVPFYNNIEKEGITIYGR